MLTDRDQQRLAGVHPRLVEILTEVFVEMLALGCGMFVVEGVRTDARQEWLYAQGRTTPGPIVTYKDGVQHRSNHQPRQDGYGYAVDCAFTPDASRHPFDQSWPWEQYGEALEAHGVTWGGRWKMGDLPHAELAYPAVLATAPVAKKAE